MAEDLIGKLGAGAKLFQSAWETASSVTFIQFMFEEAAQALSMTVWLLIQAKEWEAAQNVNDHLRDHLARARHLSSTIGWFQPHTKGAFDWYWDAAGVQNTQFALHIDRNQTKMEGTGGLRITSSPSDASILLNGVATELRTPETFRRLPPGTYAVTLTRTAGPDLHQVSAKGEVRVDAGKKAELYLVLT